MFFVIGGPRQGAGRGRRRGIACCPFRLHTQVHSMCVYLFENVHVLINKSTNRRTRMQDACMHTACESTQHARACIQLARACIQHARACIQLARACIQLARACIQLVRAHSLRDHAYEAACALQLRLLALLCVRLGVCMRNCFSLSLRVGTGYL